MTTSAGHPRVCTRCGVTFQNQPGRRLALCPDCHAVLTAWERRAWV